MNKFWNFLSEKRYFIMVILCIILIVLTLKTQVLVVKYGDDYAMRLEYTMFGYCIRASASLKATEPAIQNAVYLGDSINSSVLKAVEQMKLLSEEEQVVGIMSSGFPKNNDKLEQSVKQYLESNEHKVEVLDVSLTEAILPNK